MAPDKIYPIFFVIFGVLGGTAAIFFHFSKNAQLKRRLWPPYIIGIGLLFLGVVSLMSRRAAGDFSLVAIPMVVVITLLNLRAVRFCDACGKTIYNAGIFSRAEFCPNCGAKLK